MYEINDDTTYDADPFCEVYQPWQLEYHRAIRDAVAASGIAAEVTVSDRSEAVYIRLPCHREIRVATHDTPPTLRADHGHLPPTLDIRRAYRNLGSTSADEIRQWVDRAKKRRPPAAKALRASAWVKTALANGCPFPEYSKAFEIVRVYNAIGKVSANAADKFYARLDRRDENAPRKAVNVKVPRGVVLSCERSHWIEKAGVPVRRVFCSWSKHRGRFSPTDIRFVLTPKEEAKIAATKPQAK